MALKSLARGHQHLSREIDNLDAELASLVIVVNPALTTYRQWLLTA